MPWVTLLHVLFCGSQFSLSGLLPMVLRDVLVHPSGSSRLSGKLLLYTCRAVVSGINYYYCASWMGSTLCSLSR